MMRRSVPRRVAEVLVGAIVAATALGQPAPQPPPLPDQDIVFVIDNSTSMDDGLQASDPLRLRGVAACLILDALELSSNVRAGLVTFGDGFETDNKLHPPDVIRQRLRPDRLLPMGGTNMQPALAAAIGLLSSSTAATRRIVLLTDGMPNGSQSTTIPQEIVPHAQRVGIQIFALGLSTNIDQAFLDAVTTPTGGRTLIAQKHQQLLELAKQLVTDLDNVYPLDRKSLESEEDGYAFTVPPNVDRVRLTAILDQPKEFAPGDIELRLDGPAPADAATYNISPGGSPRVAAWTAFFSAPGNYTFRVTTTKGGGHQGLELYLDALSNLRLELLINPHETRFTVEDEVKVTANVGTSVGPVDPATVTITGSVRTPSGGTVPIAFSGKDGLFRVPAMPGQHTIIVRAATQLSRTEARYVYEALAPCAAQLKTDREELVFTGEPLGPVRTQIEETFKLFADFSCGSGPRAVSFSYTANSPVGVIELVKKGGGVLRRAPAAYALPPGGLELTLRIRMDPKAPLPPKAGKYEDQIRIFSNETNELRIPFSFDLRIPRFEVKSKPTAFSLWWDPMRPRVLKLGELQSDLSGPSTFSVTIPDALHAPNQGPKIADLALRAGDDAPEAERLEDGRLRYGSLDLPAGKSVPLALVVTPSRDTGWQNLKRSQRPIPIELQSSYGMKETFAPVFWNVDRVYGVTIAAVLLLAIGGALIALRTFLTGSIVWRFWRFRIGRRVSLLEGPLMVGDTAASGAAALVLPRSGSELDDTTLAQVTVVGRRQQIVPEAERLVVRNPIVTPGDTITVPDPVEPLDAPSVWEFNYDDYDPAEGGSLEVSAYPAKWTLGRLLRRLALALAILLGLLAFVRSGVMAAGAYSVPFIESLYVK